MEMNMGTVVHGFEITRVRTVEELDSRCVEMRHVRTGAELVWMDNGEENKLFSIAFKTIPEDSTGVFHILEHSVLCGSENYPVKEPFVELLKSSLNTFLNAMTFPDKTMYPVSSRNKKDFINLTRVYLDAVFKPAILNNPNIFYQEGWHYELTEKDSQPVYNGVVFNEMKGAYSSVDRVMDRELNALLFPDSCYGLSSGGDPVHIPELTYDRFVETYRRFYHPSNSRIYLDGDLPLEEILAIIDGEYLSGFDAGSGEAKLAMQSPVDSVESVCSYEVGADEDCTDRTHMIMGKIICDWKDRERQLAAYVLGDYLTDSNDSPLKKAILEAGLGQEVVMSIDDGTAQPVVYLLIRNTSRDKRDMISETITSTAGKLLEEGLDRQSLEAALNRIEFTLRESKEPMGLERAVNALSSWLYSGDPLLYLTQDEVFRSLREKLDSDYFEQLMKEFLVDRNNTAVLWCEPSCTLGEERRQEEAQRIAAAASVWSEEDIDRILKLNRKLEEWQQKEDSPEALAMLPELALSEVDPEPTERITEIEYINGVKVLRHPSSAKGIAYITLYFNAADVGLNDFSAMAFMSMLLGELPTTKYSAAELNREIKTHIGKLSFSVKQFSVPGEIDACRVYFTAQCSVLEEEVENAAALIAEVLTQTRFDMLDAIRPHVAQIYDRVRRSIIGQGHVFGLLRSLAPYSAEGEINELLNGYSFYEYMRRLNDSMDDGLAAFSNFASVLTDRLFCSSRMIISATSGSKTDVGCFASGLQAGKALEKEKVMPQLAGSRRECIRIPAAVSFAEMGTNVYALGREYSAGLKLMAHIVSYNYLWNAIRVQGGAYGAGLTVSDSGNICYYTYRDPNSSRSLEIFRKASEFLREFCSQEESLEKSIIGCISHLDPLVTSRERGAAADSDYFREINHRKRCEIWKELLGMDRDKLAGLCDILDRMADKSSICVIGSSDIVAACDKEQLAELIY